MKRISHIVNPQGIRTDVITRKEERILRQVDQAVASVEDLISETDEKISNLIDSLGEASTGSDTPKLQKKLNDYCDLCTQKETAQKYIVYLTELKSTLNEEVEVTIDPVHVVIDEK